MSPTEAPDFRLLLVPFIEKIPEPARPGSTSGQADEGLS